MLVNYIPLKLIETNILSKISPPDEWVTAVPSAEATLVTADGL